MSNPEVEESEESLTYPDFVDRGYRIEYLTGLFYELAQHLMDASIHASEQPDGALPQLEEKTQAAALHWAAREVLNMAGLK